MYNKADNISVIERNYDVGKCVLKLSGRKITHNNHAVGKIEHFKKEVMKFGI